MMQRIEDAKPRLSRRIQNLQHMGNTTICFCDSLQAIPYLASFGNEIVVRIDDEKCSDLFVKLQLCHCSFPLCIHQNSKVRFVACKRRQTLADLNVSISPLSSSEAQVSAARVMARQDEWGLAGGASATADSEVRERKVKVSCK